jgi:predicted RNA binding protein YcfA (HicA-like mRNA interferase family)
LLTSFHSTLSQNITSKKLIAALKSLGFVEKSRLGSHIFLTHPDYRQRVVLPVTSSKKPLSPALVLTVSKVITEAGIVSKEDLEKLIEAECNK